MCSFCWAFRSTWETVLPQLKDTVNVVNVVGGLAPDSDQPMPSEMQSKLSGTWKHIEHSILGTQFNHAFWSECKPRRSTYPACRAALIARNISHELEDKMTLAIQQAYYLNAQNPSDEDTLITAAASIGLDTTAFAQSLRSEEINTQLTDELKMARSLGLNSFPGLLITDGNKGFHIPIEYNDTDEMLNRIHSAVKEICQ